MSELKVTIPEEARQTAFNAAVEYHGIHPTGSQDADTADIVDASLGAAAPLIVATELQRIADGIDTLSAEPGNAVLKAEASGRREIRQVLLGRAADLRGVSADGGTEATK